MQDQITGVAHFGIRVRELERSRAFYELLGFEFVIGPVGPEPVAIMKHPSGVEINFVLNASVPEENNILMDVPDKYPGYTHAALAVKNVDDVKLALDAAGIEITGGPNDYPHGSRGMFVRDPDRNVIEFYQPAK